MPFVRIEMFEGRSKEMKNALIKEVTDAVVKAIGAKPEQVRVILYDLKKEDVGKAGVQYQ